jgi:putative glutamine amidotransferase
MASLPTPPRIGVLGSDLGLPGERHGCGLWPAGSPAALIQAGAEPVTLSFPTNSRTSLDSLFDGMHGVVLTGIEPLTGRQLQEAERLCNWCKRRSLPILGVDAGLHALNTAFGGTLYEDLARELPEALQHRHPPEKGLRHAIEVIPDSKLAELYGEGEVVVNSEHRRAVQRLARGFRIGARALDGCIEAIESESETWFALAVQWHPASTTASGLDIQLYRGLVEACRPRVRELVGAA